MIVKEIKGDIIEITSSEGYKIRQVQTGRVYSSAEEMVNGIHYDYEEVIPSEDI